MFKSSPIEAGTTHSLARNTILNLVGQIVPMLIGLLSIPMLITRLGMERFGLLSLVWVVIGYFTFFDLGLGRAIIKVVAEKIGKNEEEHIPKIVWGALSIMTAMSLIGSIVLCLLTPTLVTSVFKIPSSLHNEAVNAFYGLSLSLSFVTLTAGLRGILEARHRFDYANILQTLTGATSFVGPLVVSFYSQNIAAIVAVIIIARLLLFVVHLILVLRLYPDLRRPGHIDRQTIKRLFRFATWMTVSNIVSPIMVYFDRFILGAIVPVATLAFYTTPFEVVNRLLVVPAAMVRTLFPAFAFLGIDRSSEHVTTLFERGLKFLWFVLFPAVFLIVYFGREGLGLWLGADFAHESTIVLQILAIGILLNGLAYIPFTLLQSADRPDLTAKLHLIELPLYLPLVWFLATRFGVKGAAAAWSIRVALDMILMFTAVFRIFPAFSKHLLKLMLPFTLILFSLLPPFFPIKFGLKIGIAIVVLPLFALLFWGFILKLQDRLAILDLFHARAAKKSSFRLNQMPDQQSGVWAIVVTYNPDQEIAANLKSYANQVDQVIVIDNGSTAATLNFLNEIGIENVVIVRNQDNLGIAAALNEGVRIAHKNGAAWVVTFDQDSKVGPNYILTFLRLLEEIPNPNEVAMLAPSFVDANSGRIFRHGRATELPWSEIKSAFTSGAMVRLSAFEKVGLFEEKMFIDYVDHEFCLRLLSNGYRMLESQNNLCIHNLGRMRIHWVLYRTFSATHHNPERRYFMARNRVFLYRRYWLIEPLWILNDILSATKEIIKIILVEDQKLQKLRNIALGTWHGAQFKTYE
jgi:O-antigen/teichoic acid export membrane protein/GT2 family glycosyltransferase